MHESLGFYLDNSVDWLHWQWCELTDWQQWCISLSLWLRDLSGYRPGSKIYQIRWFLFNLAVGKNIREAMAESQEVAL